MEENVCSNPIPPLNVCTILFVLYILRYKMCLFLEFIPACK